MVLRLHFIKVDLVLRQNSIKRNLENIPGKYSGLR